MIGQWEKAIYAIDTFPTPVSSSRRRRRPKSEQSRDSWIVGAGVGGSVPDLTDCVHNLLDELAASRASRRSAWTILQELRAMEFARHWRSGNPLLKSSSKQSNNTGNRRTISRYTRSTRRLSERRSS